MRKTNTFKIQGRTKQYEVKELTVREIVGLIQNKALDGDLTIDVFKQYFAELLPQYTNLEMDELMDFTPSELKEVWDNFAEVNATFFDVARRAGLESMMEKLKEAMFGDFGDLLAPSLNQDTPTA